MTRRWLAAAAIALAGCAAREPSPQAFSFGVMGDAPYNDREEKAFAAMLPSLDSEALAFVVHVGDIQHGPQACSDATYARRKAQFDASANPFIYTPGDNEWTDCRFARPPVNDPIERLGRLRQVFFASTTTLGKQRFETAVQEDYPENRLWSRANVVFVTLDIPGSDNNMGYDARNDAEAHARDAANARWLARAVDEALAHDAAALVLFIQANPWFVHKEKRAFVAFLASLREAAARFRKPILFVHGDTHTYRIDAPLTDAAGAPVANVTRLETYGSPFVGWVRVTVDPADPQPFEIRGNLYAIVP